MLSTEILASLLKMLVHDIYFYYKANKKEKILLEHRFILKTCVSITELVFFYSK